MPLVFHLCSHCMFWVERSSSLLSLPFDGLFSGKLYVVKTSRIPLEANVFLPLVNPLSAFLSMFSTLCCVCQSFPIYGLPFLLCLAVGSSMTAQSPHQGILGVGLFTCQRLTWTPAGLRVTGWDGYLSLELCPAAGPWALCHFPMPQIPRPLRKPPHSGDSWILEFLGFILKSIEFQSHEKAERHMEIFYLSFF